MKANGLTGKFAMAMPVGFFEDSGLGAGDAGAEEREEADETGETVSAWAPWAVELPAALGGGYSERQGMRNGHVRATRDFLFHLP